MGDFGLKAFCELVRESLSVAVALAEVGQRFLLFAALGHRIDKFLAKVDCDVHQGPNDCVDGCLVDGFVELRVDDMPELSVLCLITPVGAEEPSDQD